MKIKFTELWLRSLKAPAVETMHTDTDVSGLKLRHLPSGTCSFCFIYQVAGKKKRMTLGPYPALSLADARQMGREIQMERGRGKDPVAERKAAKRQQEQQKTVGWLIDEYLERWAKPRKKTWTEDERILNKRVRPRWGDRPIKDVTKKDIIELLDSLIDEGMKAGANRNFAIIRRMFNFAVERDLIEHSPCYKVKAPAPEQSRDRNLSWSEINHLWEALEAAKMAPGTKLALKLQLITGQRTGEVTGAALAEFDLAAGWWTLPKERAKNGRSHRVPLSDLAIELVGAAMALHSDRAWLFPKPGGGAPILAESVGHALAKHRDSEGNTLGLPKFTSHDLRRTAASRMAELGVPHEVIGKILNHAEPGVTWRYDRHSYDTQKRDALEALGAKLDEVVSAVAEASATGTSAARDVAENSSSTHIKRPGELRAGPDRSNRDRSKHEIATPLQAGRH